ncbi:hypothetical protein [Streptomyces liangshanensis]|uniref:hypothetical protein n=1 Tax=Streptomyces liangshanensis TaxID=2717324 RepID=UPI0036DF0062
MRRRSESVPFAFVAEAERFRSNVTPPPRQRPSPRQILGRSLTALAVVAGFAGSLLLGLPALQTDQTATHTHHTATVRSR